MNTRIKGLLILFIPVAVIALIMFLPAIPAKIPMQIGVDGKVNWYLSKWLFPYFGVIPYLFWRKYG